MVPVKLLMLKFVFLGAAVWRITLYTKGGSWKKVKGFGGFPCSVVSGWCVEKNLKIG